MRFRFTPKNVLKITFFVVVMLFLAPIIINQFAWEHEYIEKSHLEKNFEFDPNVELAEVKSSLGNFEPDFPSENGPGENGVPVRISQNENERSQQSISEFGFNMVVSDKISLTRNIPDTRHSECRYWHYPETGLSTASIIIVFHNEGYSTLLRTIHSVIKTSPKHLLKEIVLVDDFSDKVDLKERLETYIKKFGDLVRLFRNTERLGLILTRSKGASLAVGDVIVFLDAHCECGKNWLVPLLDRIRINRKTMAVPTIDSIDWNDFHYSPVYQAGALFRGIFEWGFLYKESHVPNHILKARRYKSDPYPSPTHAGGLFAMERKYFLELGGYDPGLQIWGGENFELSFKMWQCGGKIEWVPCSRVGHIYRRHMPYGFGKIKSTIPVILINYMRVVEVWLDDVHKEFFYTREPAVRGYPIGNITKQLEFKKKNNCKSFQWFLDNVAPEVARDFPNPPPNVAWGQVRSRNLCWDTFGRGPKEGAIEVTECQNYGGTQLFRLNERGQMAHGERCVDSYSSDQLSLIFCPVEPAGSWSYDEKTSQLKLAGKCATVDFTRRKLTLQWCDSVNRGQKFAIEEVKTW